MSDEFGALRVIERDGVLTPQLRCPGCGCWGDIDDDQLHGRVSVDHTDCTTGSPRRSLDHPCKYHETHDFDALAVWLETDTSRRLGWGQWANCPESFPPNGMACWSRAGHEGLHTNGSTQWGEYVR